MIVDGSKLPQFKNLHRHGRGRQPSHQDGKMNKLESEYAVHLEIQRRAGDILSYQFEAVKLRIAKTTFYTPDFLVMRSDNLLVFHEVKGFWRDDARVKIKAAASLFPFRFVAVKKKAKKDGGADQSLLRQLDDLAGLYDRPWRVTLLAESFADGDFTADPVWSVASGRFSVDSRSGLRNRAGRPARADFGSDEQNGGDAAAQLFGAILSGIVGQQTGDRRDEAPRAEIHTRLAISDAFTAEVEFAGFTAPAEGGGFEFGVYWGNYRDRGYRLVYSQGAEPSLALLRLLKGGVSTIARTALAQDLEDGAYHRITLRRGRGGVMDALVDGEIVISGVTSITGGKPFAGLTLINRGGDFAFRGVTVMGTNQ